MKTFIFFSRSLIAVCPLIAVLTTNGAITISVVAICSIIFLMWSNYMTKLESSLSSAIEQVDTQRELINEAITILTKATKNQGSLHDQQRPNKGDDERSTPNVLHMRSGKFHNDR